MNIFAMPQINDVLIAAGISLDALNDPDGAQVWTWSNDAVLGSRIVVLPRGNTTKEEIEAALTAADIETYREEAGGIEWIVWTPIIEIEEPEDGD